MNFLIYCAIGIFWFGICMNTDNIIGEVKFPGDELFLEFWAAVIAVLVWPATVLYTLGKLTVVTVKAIIRLFRGSNNP